ncbi:TRAP transporter small permease [Planifilum fimeticola]
MNRWMERAGRWFEGLLNLLIALSLAGMSALVFLNVVLRYFFDSGITWSEEMSRFLFVWMVFLGAIAALKERMHLAVDVVFKRLSSGWKKFFAVISHSLVLYVLWLVFDGSWKMTWLNMASKAPATGVSLGFVYGVGVVTSLAMAVIVILRLFRILFGGSGESDFSLSEGSADTD